jgi:class 3 adenylate cyclase/predicted ATPase
VDRRVPKTKDFGVPQIRGAVMSDVAQWLGELGLGQYAAAFHDNDIEFELLPRLTDEQLKELGVSSMGHRMKILAAIEKSSGQPGKSLAGPEPSDDAKEPTIAQRVDAERRQLTVMFCDLVGSTALSTKFDPEDLSELITSFQDRCRQAIKQYQGFIARYMGDGILVYFGYPQAHEDDAERAVRAGLAIVRSMAELNAEIGRRHEVVLAVRVGVATGLVVVGDIIGEGVAEEAAVVGETPNLAARLQGMAEPNQVVVASATQRLLGALFEYEDLGTHELKGIAQPVQVWRVLREGDIESRYEAKRVGGGLPLVGRQEELGLLVRSWEASKEGHGQVVLIQGEAGIGKSRLLEALREHVSGEDYTWVANWCSPYHANSTLYPVIEHMKRVMGWKPEDGTEEKLKKLEAALKGQSLPPEEAVPLYAELMSLPLPEGRYAPLELSAKQQREQTLDALAGWLLEEAERTHVLHVWEDVHWADPTTLELLGLYIEQSPTVSMLNVLTYRPEFAPPWSMHSHMTPITLNRLERPEVEALIGYQANGKAVPSEVIEHIVAKADGVPLYVEELTKSILESDYLHEEADRYTLAGSLSEVSIPTTLQDSLMARLDRLPTVRELAQLGAVIGREFTYQMLCSLAPHEESVVQDGLGRLVEDELLYQRGRPPRSRYIFKHALIQDAAYQSLLKRTRQQYHQQVAALMEERSPETVAAQPELVAHHYGEAGCTEEAVTYSQKAGQIALGRSANVEAVTHFDKGLEQLSQLPETTERNKRELEMQMALGPALVAARGFAETRVGHAYARAWELCQRLGDNVHLPLVLRGREVFHYVSGEFNKAREFAKQLLDLAERQQDPALLVGSYHALGQTLFSLGDLIAARRTVEQGIALFDPRQHRLPNWPGGQPGEQCYLYGAFALWMLGYPDQAIRRGEEALAMANELSNPANLINTLAFVALVHVLRRELAAARQRAEAAMEMSAEQRNPFFLAYGTVLHGWAQAAQDQGEDGIAKVNQAIAAYGATGSKTWLPYLLALQAETYGRAKRTEDGLASVAEAQALADKTEEHCWQAELNRIKGELLLAGSSENHAEAESCFSQALDIARRQQAKSWELRGAMSLSRLWQRQSKQAEAHKLLAGVYRWFNEGFDTADLKDAKTLLEELT